MSTPNKPCCTSPRPDCMGMLVQGIGNRCQALQDTSMGTVPRTTAGAGALAPAPQMLTIDRDGLRLFLDAERRDVAAMHAMDQVMGGGTFSELDVPLCHAWACVLSSWRVNTERIVKRGGLLHIGAGV